jgi:hypothetical protein
MTLRTVAIAALIWLFPHYAYSDGRVTFRLDFNAAEFDGAFNDVGMSWEGLEVEIEKEFTTSKVLLSGFSLGLRRELFYAFTGFGSTKDVHRWDEGTYLTFRMFRSFDLTGSRSWSIRPSLTILYGIPGTTMSGTIGRAYADGGYDYTHVFPMRNADVPPVLAEQAQLNSNSALFYPEASLSLTRRLAKGGVVVEWLGGVRMIRFGIVDSNIQGNLFTERRTFIPSVGLRVGFKVF